MYKTTEISESAFGILNNEEAKLYTLTNRRGTEVKITNYGATITSWKVLNADNTSSNIVLGFDSLIEYIEQPFYFGATIGRCANLTADSKFTIGNKKYHLNNNHKKHHLHGGLEGFDKKIWKSRIQDKPSVLHLNYKSPHLEEEYPGNLDVQVSYQLTDQDELIINYTYSTDQDTIVNLTNHSYFNLNESFDQNILNHEILINADFYTPVNAEKIVIGEILPLRDTAFDFNHIREIGDRIEEVSGYNHNYVLNRTEDTKVQLAAVLREPSSKKQIEVYTSEPGLQFYTGNSLKGNIMERSGFVIGQYMGLCLETQKFPNSANHTHFPSIRVYPNEIYESTTIYKFSKSAS